MNKKLTRIAVVAGAMTAFALPSTTALAGHCADNGGPGNSDFADHVRATNGNGEHNEGDHQGWSSCEETAQSDNANRG